MKLTIIGASGHGKVVADIALLCGYDKIQFLDDDESLVSCNDWLVIGKSKLAADIENDIFIAIGDAKIRKRMINELHYKKIPTLIHPSATIASDVKIGKGSVVMAGAVINPGVKIGRACIINTSSSVDHDCKLSDYVHVSVGAHLCGADVIGEGTWIGAGATISNNVGICGGCMIGAGAVVIKDIEEIGTYIGVPSKKMDKNLIRGGIA